MKRGLIVGVGICILLGVLLLTVGKSNNESRAEADDGGLTLASAYKSDLERICAYMCSSLEGVESATVNITLDGGMRCVYAKNSEGSYGGTYFSSGGEPVLLNYDYPQIKGCAVMCSGAITDQKKLEMTDMLCAYLGIASNRIYIGYSG